MSKLHTLAEDINKLAGAFTFPLFITSKNMRMISDTTVIRYVVKRCFPDDIMGIEMFE